MTAENTGTRVAKPSKGSKSKTEAVAADGSAVAPAGKPFEVVFVSGSLTPPKRTGNPGAGRGLAFPLERLDVGQYFLFPEASAAAVKRTCASANKKHSKAHDTDTRTIKGKTVPVRVPVRKFVAAKLTSEQIATLDPAVIAAAFPGATEDPVIWACFRTL